MDSPVSLQKSYRIDLKDLVTMKIAVLVLALSHLLCVANSNKDQKIAHKWLG